MDAIYVTGQLLQLPLIIQSPDLPFTLKRNLHLMGRRLLLLNATLGHAESIFQNVKSFENALQSFAKMPQYHEYREETLQTLERIAGAYPDTRAYAHMISLERTPGGNLDRARQYCLLGLERPTRPKGYELTLIHTGEVLHDYTDAMKALKLAVEIIVSDVEAPTNDPFPFATRQRWIAKYMALETVARVLLSRAKEMTHSSDARDIAKFRASVLAVKKEMKDRLTGVGSFPLDEQWKLFTTRSLDDILFQLLDPEAVLEEEELMKIRHVKDEHTFGGEKMVDPGNVADSAVNPFASELITDVGGQSRPLAA